MSSPKSKTLSSKPTPKNLSSKEKSSWQLSFYAKRSSNCNSRQENKWQSGVQRSGWSNTCNVSTSSCTIGIYLRHSPLWSITFGKIVEKNSSFPCSDLYGGPIQISLITYWPSNQDKSKSATSEKPQGSQKMTSWQNWMNNSTLLRKSLREFKSGRKWGSSMYKPNWPSFTTNVKPSSECPHSLGRSMQRPAWRIKSVWRHLIKSWIDWR
jgi:hypothetical protein